MPYIEVYTGPSILEVTVFVDANFFVDSCWTTSPSCKVSLSASSTVKSTVLTEHTHHHVTIFALVRSVGVHSIKTFFVFRVTLAC